MARRLFTSRLISTATVVCFLNAVGVVRADVVVLKSGTQLQCIVANREQIASSPQSFSQVSIVLHEDGQDSMQRVNVADINYILLEDGAQKRVIEFSPAMKQAPDSSWAQQRHDKIVGATSAAVIGAGLGILGAANKFGGPKASVSGSSISVDDESYNGVNYALMVLGGAMFVIGMAVLSTTAPKETAGLHLTTSGLGLCYRVTY